MMRRLLDAIYRWLHDPRYLQFFGIQLPADEDWLWNVTEIGYEEGER